MFPGAVHYTASAEPSYPCRKTCCFQCSPLPCSSMELYEQLSCALTHSPIVCVTHVQLCLCLQGLLLWQITGLLPPTSSSTYLFRLMAVVVHHGDMHSGHFVTYRRSPPSAKNPLSTSNQWLWISDDTVRKASLQEVLSSSAYLLFYERVLPRAQREYRSEE